MSAPPSQHLLRAQQFEREGRHQEAMALVREAAQAGDAQAQYLLGLHMVRGVDRAEGIDLIAQAAAGGHAAALHRLAVITGAGHGRPQDWAQSVRLLSAAADAGDLDAKGELDVLGPAGAFDAQEWLSPPPARVAFEAPRVGVIEGFLAPHVCDWIVRAAKRKRMQRASLMDAKTSAGAAHPGRTNSTLYLDILEADVVVRLVKARIAAALGVPVGRQESANVLRYETGQRFDQHCDFLDPADPAFREQIATFGQRVATFLIYLNDDYEGGETAFPLLQWSYRGRQGDALFFWNVSVDGKVEQRLLHAGRPPTRGEKWLFSQWVRSKPVEWGVKDEA